MQAGKFPQILMVLKVRLFRKLFGVDFPEHYIRNEKQKPKMTPPPVYSEPQTTEKALSSIHFALCNFESMINDQFRNIHTCRIDTVAEFHSIVHFVDKIPAIGFE
jgi:hypothetical protein